MKLAIILMGTRDSWLGVGGDTDLVFFLNKISPRGSAKECQESESCSHHQSGGRGVGDEKKDKFFIGAGQLIYNL